MRSLIFILAVVLLSSLFSCTKDEDDVTRNIEVEEYIELLLAGEYDSRTLPEFTNEDIPELLHYRNTTQLISNFPHNPISSFIGPECTLGMYVLWTIESIRSVSIDSEYLILRFPSLNPILTIRNSDELELVYTETAQMKAANAYFDWWESNKFNDFDSFMHIDPLWSTQYKWH